MDTYIDKIEKYSTILLTSRLSEKMVYHDITYTHRLVEAVEEIASIENISDIEKEILVVTAWMINIGFTELNSDTKIENPEDLFNYCYKCSSNLASKYLQEIGYPTERMNEVLKLLDEARPDAKESSHLSDILKDAITIDWGKSKSKQRIKKLYEEFLLTGAVSVGKGAWYDTVLTYLREHEFKTNYGKKVLSKGKLSLISKIEKEKKVLAKTESSILKKELSISDEELKKLKKSLSSIKGRDERGVQTMFRTTSRNHYTLSQMVDRKANIMISINAILLSLIISRTIGEIDTFCIHNAPVLIILISSILSMFFAIIAITPFKTQGTFTEKQIREKEGNLLYFGNVHKMNFRDYEWGMLEMVNDAKFLYSSMIRDLYFLGKTLHAKSQMIRFSLGSFIIGLIISTILFIIVSTLSDFHFGLASHN